MRASAKFAERTVGITNTMRINGAIVGKTPSLEIVNCSGNIPTNYGHMLFPSGFQERREGKITTTA